MTNIYLVLSGLGSDLQLRLRQKEVVSLKTAPNDHFSTLKRLQSSIADSYLESQSQHQLEFTPLYLHKTKGGFSSTKQEHNIEKINSVVKVLLTLLILRQWRKNPTIQ